MWMEWAKMKKIDLGMVLFWLFVILMAIIVVALIVVEIKADIAIITSDNIPFWMKWALLTHGGK